MPLVLQPNRLRRTELSAFARELYPQSMGAALEELQSLARQLQQVRDLLQIDSRRRR